MKNASTALILRDNLNEPQDDDLDIPIDISDILTVCKQYSQLGYQIQSQIEWIVEVGIDEAVQSGVVSIAALPHIKDFLSQIHSNVYFGDASVQAYQVVGMIDRFEEENPLLFRTVAN